MLHAHNLVPQQGVTVKTIAGNNSGKRVLCSSHALPIFNGLVKHAQKNNYWAMSIIKGIQGLSSGTLHMNNIYIKPGISRKPGESGVEVFYAFLPGVKVTFDKLSKDQYLVQNIEIDPNYVRQQKSDKKLGLWKVSKNENARPEYQPNGIIKAIKNRVVVITDIVESNPVNVSMKIREGLSKKVNDSISQEVKNYGFDMHYSPGNEGIVGLQNANKSLETYNGRKIAISALMLADMMYKSREIERVLWYSDSGGSGILNRALEIINKQYNITLETHNIFLNKPRTKPKTTIDLAKKVGIVPIEKGKRLGYHYKDVVGSLDYTDVSLSGMASAIPASMTMHGLAATAISFGTDNPVLGAYGIFMSVSGGLVTVVDFVKSHGERFLDRPYR